MLELNYCAHCGHRRGEYDKVCSRCANKHFISQDAMLEHLWEIVIFYQTPGKATQHSPRPPSSSPYCSVCSCLMQPKTSKFPNDTWECVNYDCPSKHKQICLNCFAPLKLFGSSPNQWRGCVNPNCKGGSVYCLKCGCSMERSLAKPYTYECCSLYCINNESGNKHTCQFNSKNCGKCDVCGKTEDEMYFPSPIYKPTGWSELPSTFHKAKAQEIVERLKKLSIDSCKTKIIFEEFNESLKQMSQRLTELTPREKLAKDCLIEAIDTLKTSEDFATAEHLTKKLNEIFPPEQSPQPKYHIVKEVKSYGYTLGIASDESIRVAHVIELPDLTSPEVLYELWTGYAIPDGYTENKKREFSKFAERLSKLLGEK